MKTAWLTLLACSLAGALATTACEIKEGSPDDGDGGSDDTGGTTSSGGRSSGGATSTGGKPASGGSGSGGASTGGATAKGGSSGTGGTGGSAPMCDKPLGTPADSCDVPTDMLEAFPAKCVECLKKDKAPNCCDELKDCYATSPDNECGYGGPADNPGQTEYLCFIDCLNLAAMNGEIIDDDVEAACAGSCTRCGAISDETNALIACMLNACPDDCLPQ